MYKKYFYFGIEEHEVQRNFDEVEAICAQSYNQWISWTGDVDDDSIECMDEACRHAARRLRLDQNSPYYDPSALVKYEEYEERYVPSDWELPGYEEPEPVDWSVYCTLMSDDDIDEIP